MRVGRSRARVDTQSCPTQDYKKWNVLDSNLHFQVFPKGICLGRGETTFDLTTS